MARASATDITLSAAGTYFFADLAGNNNNLLAQYNWLIPQAGQGNLLIADAANNANWKTFAFSIDFWWYDQSPGGIEGWPIVINYEQIFREITGESFLYWTPSYGFKGQWQGTVNQWYANGVVGDMNSYSSSQPYLLDANGQQVTALLTTYDQLHISGTYLAYNDD